MTTPPFVRRLVPYLPPKSGVYIVIILTQTLAEELPRPTSLCGVGEFLTSGLGKNNYYYLRWEECTAFTKGFMNVTNRPLMKWLQCSRKITSICVYVTTQYCIFKVFCGIAYLFVKKETDFKKVTCKAFNKDTAWLHCWDLGIYLKHCCTILSLFLTAGFYPPPSG